MNIDARAAATPRAAAVEDAGHADAPNASSHSPDPARLRGRRLAALLAVLFGVALVARIAAWVAFPDPAYPDSFYYVAVARSLAAGTGFQVPFVWNFVDVGGQLPALGVLPIPSNAHWMPLASIVQVPFIWLIGPTSLASCLPFWLLSAIAAPLTFLLGRDAGLDERVSLASAVLMVVPAGAAPYLSQPDNFALYMVLGVLALWACARGLRGDRRAFALGGLAVGLATLARTDGVLLGVPFALAFIVEQWRGWRAGRGPQAGRVVGDSMPTIGWRGALACCALFAAVMVPWWTRDLAVFGSIAPSSESGRILWIRTYEQLFSAADETTPATFFAQGPIALVASRLGGFVAAAWVLAATALVFFLAPLVAVGAWVKRRDVTFRPWLVYGATFLLACGAVFAVHVPHGMVLHSGLALVPQAYLLAFVGLGEAVRWVAARRSGWNRDRATRNFALIAVAVGWAFGLLGTVRLSAEWRAETEARRALLGAAPVIAAGDLLMSPDPGAFWYRFGVNGIITPNDPSAIVEAAARSYGVRWLMLERDHVVPSLWPVLAGAERPDWLSAPIAIVRSDGTVQVAPATAVASGATTPEPAPRAGASAALDLPIAALYAVCLDPGDTRCSTAP
jgi:hypothetical protein